MKIKPIYLYLGVFVIFSVAVIFFSNSTKESNRAKGLNPSAEMPNDDIHKGIKSDGKEGTPSRSNVRQEALERMNALKSEVEKNPNDTAKVRQYADMLTMGHNSDEAAKLYEKILKIDPKRIDIMLQLTFVYYNKGDLNKAEEYTNKVLKINKDHLIANYNLGAIAVARGENQKAKAIWQDLAKKYPQTEIGSIAGESAKQLDQIPKR
ncbi:MAG: tetratricopeptide repeat protein [Bacteroidota bacterium]